MVDQQFNDFLSGFANGRLSGREWWIKGLGMDFVQAVIMGDE